MGCQLFLLTPSLTHGDSFTTKRQRQQQVARRNSRVKHSSPPNLKATAKTCHPIGSFSMNLRGASGFCEAQALSLPGQ